VYHCTFNGQKHLLANRSDNAYIICPRLAVVCPEMYSCPDGCFGKGICVNPPQPNSTYQRPYCKCLNESNTDPSCAPSMFASTNRLYMNDTKDIPSTAPTVPIVVPTAANPISTSSLSSYHNARLFWLYGSQPSDLLLLLLVVVYSFEAMIPLL
jgi:hypothetical protein